MRVLASILLLVLVIPPAVLAAVTCDDPAATSLVSWLLLSCEQPFGFHPAVVGTCGPDFQCHPG